MRRLVLLLSAPPQAWVKSLTGLEGISVKILDCRPTDGDESMSEFFEIYCPRGAMPDVVRRLYQAEGIEDLEITLKPSAKKVVGSLITSRCKLCKHLCSSVGCFPGSAVYDVGSEWLRWSLYVRDDHVSKILDALAKENISYVVEDDAAIDVPDELTPKQKQLLEVAVKTGFFNVPRRAGTRKLAKELGVAPASLSISLRRALKKVVTGYLRALG